MWLWHDTAHIAYGVHRTAARDRDFRDEAGFVPVADELARTAAAEMLQMRARFPDLGAVAAELLARPSRPGRLRDDFDAGIVAGLTGDAAAARARFAAVLAEEPVGEWAHELRRTAGRLHAEAGDRAAVAAWTAGAVASCRAKLGLGPPPEGAGPELSGA